MPSAHVIVCLYNNIPNNVIQVKSQHDDQFIVDTLHCRVYYNERRCIMTRTFIEVPSFSKRWKEIGLNDDDLHTLQLMLLKDPEAGPVIEGTGGIRKIRFALHNKGKRGSARVCYVDFAEYEVTYLITAFTKKEQDNLTDYEKAFLKKMVKSLKDEIAKNRR